MKRCPQCEFLYEDDQSLCDMDGMALARDSTPTIFPENQTEKKKVAFKRRWGTSVAPGFAGLILAAVLYLAYASPPLVDSSSKRPNPETGTISSSSRPRDLNAPLQKFGEKFTSIHNTDNLSDEKTIKIPSRNETPATAKSDSGTNDERLTIPKRLPPLPRVPPLRRLPTATVAPEKLTVTRSNSRKPLAAEQKKQSRVGSFLKKTGRMLRKPFKL